MAFDAFCYSKDMAEDIGGETQDSDYAGKKAFEILSFELGAENVINIGSVTGGGGAGKATFKEFTVTKKTDSSSTKLFTALCTGLHYKDVIVDLRRSGAATKTMKSGGVFMKFDMRLVMVQDISWSGSDGDDVCEETVIFQFGAIAITYTPQDKEGKEKSKLLAMWSRVKNQNTTEV
ncbi:MAG: Hcp family type VI secretion system effector [Gemmobacter sp.]